MPAPRQARRLTPEQAARYRELLRVSDPDALHDVLLRHGPAILDRELPYVVVAAKHQASSRARRGAPRYEVPMPDASAEIADHTWDPMVRLLASERTRELLRELGELDPRDLLVVWGHAAGRSDKEIAARWDELGYEPRHPSPELLRTRRARARARLRSALARSHDM